MGVFAEFERSMIQERVKAGIKRVRAKRQQWGRRKIEEPDPALGPQISELRQQGYGWERSGNGSDRVFEQSGDVRVGCSCHRTSHHTEWLISLVSSLETVNSLTWPAD